MKKIRYILPLTLFLLGGCLNTQQVERLFLPRVSDEEAFAVANEYLAKSKNRPSAIDNNLELWLQPANKSIPCKLCVFTNKNDDITKSIGFKVYWDGACKNGYAYGLGREFAKTAIEQFEEIFLYSGKKEKPEFFSQKDRNQNQPRKYGIFDKENNKIYLSWIEKIDENEIAQHYASKDISTGDSFFIQNCLIGGFWRIIKANSSGLYYKLQIPIFADRMIVSFETFDCETDERIGFISLLSHGKDWRHFRVQNGAPGEEVILPDSRIQLIADIEKEANSVINNCSESENFSKNVVDRYKQMIKNGEVKNNFMPQNDYMDIFKEDEDMKTLNKEIMEKINSITDAQQRERLIRAREQEALAAQRQAKAAESAAIGAMLHNSALQGTNQQLQNLNQQLQYMRMGL